MCPASSVRGCRTLPECVRAHGPLAKPDLQHLGACCSSRFLRRSRAVGEHKHGPRPSSTPTAEATAQPRFVSESEGWSIAVPPGWEVVSPNGMFAASGGGAIAEVLVSSSWGLTLEQLETRTLEDLSAWPEAVEVEAELVRLPAGDAVWAALEMNGPEHGPAVFILYRMDDGDRLYAISVRGPGDGADLVPIAKALAESFAIDD